MLTHYEALADHLKDIHNLNMAYWVLQWDQNTYMPPQGAAARASQMATLQRIRHERLASDTTIRLIEAAEKEVDLSAYDSIETSMIRVARQDYEDAVQLPSDFVAEYAETTAGAFDIWRGAKANNDYKAFMPTLQRLIDLKLREADLRGYAEHPYDVFLHRWEKGLLTSQIRDIFEAQRPALVELVRAISQNQDKVDDSILHQNFDIDSQRKLSKFVSTAFGFDYENWATFDEAPHPFCIQVARGDIRLTTRFRENFFNPAFFGTLHETGHGLHGHGFAEEIDGTFLSDMEIFSHAVCESQSRTWENLVGRSAEFWQWLTPHLTRYLPEQFRNIEARQMYKAVNKARPQLIRVEADEVTYNLHIMLRFELEVELVSGKLSLEDAPEAWNDKCEAYFGMRPADDARGILQDVHWSVGGMGAFVGYALGNMLSVQYYNQALAAHPHIPDDIAQGNFSTLRNWLTENIYKHGRKYTAEELTRRVTGEDMQARDYIAYLQAKVADVYELA